MKQDIAKTQRHLHNDTPVAYPAPFHYKGRFDPYLAGVIVYAHIPFEGCRNGKDRPVVIVSVDDGCYYVRPVYSKASKCAGGWRAIPVDLSGTRLRHPGYLSPDTFRVENVLKGRKGRLSIADWNNLRIGAPVTGGAR